MYNGGETDMFPFPINQYPQIANGGGGLVAITHLATTASGTAGTGIT